YLSIKFECIPEAALHSFIFPSYGFSVIQWILYPTILLVNDNIKKIDIMTIIVRIPFIYTFD
ncbi:MAG: hypothetical protein VXY64_02600, partial [Pseudomonadota bacterium]|nr:hypothetical protein [Pseudomonadota bacterium]